MSDAHVGLVVDDVGETITRHTPRGGVALPIFELQIARAASPEFLLSMAVCAVGLEAIVYAAKECKAATLAMVGVPLAACFSSPSSP